LLSPAAACIVGQTCSHEEWMTQERVYQLENKQMLDSWARKNERDANWQDRLRNDLVPGERQGREF
jgi:hypothetical protein